MQMPSSDEVEQLRKGLRKRKLPHVFDGMWCSEPGIGGVKFTANGTDFYVEWVSFEGGVKSELKRSEWRNLCIDPALERQRLEIGYVIAAALLEQAQKHMDSIGHPTQAFKEAEPYRQSAEEWKHWALVRAGHMIGV